MSVQEERQALQPQGDDKEKHLSETAVWSYAVGHVMNDACASCWFSYLIVYLERVRNLSCLNAGIVMFSGQIFDAVATPIAGHLSDKTPGVHALGWSGRKLWYFIGTVIVILCFWGVFAMSPFEGQGVLSVIYFATGASAFNVGWAIVQVCHLAMGPELTTLDSERDRLAKLRYAFTIISNLSVFLLYLSGEGDTKQASVGGELRNGVWRFKLISMAVLGVGGLFAFIFLKGTPAWKPPPHPVSNGGSSAGGYHAVNDAEAGQHRHPPRPLSREWHHWFVIGDFYLNAVVFMCSRIVVNISQVYIQFYLLDTLLMGDEALALVPLTLYLAGLAATLGVERFNDTLGRKAAFIVAGLVVLGACGMLYVLTPRTGALVYVAAIILGVGSTTIMILANCLANDLVGEHASCSAGFVFGAFSLTDKLANGLLIMGVQMLKQITCPSDDSISSEACACLIRRVVVFLPGLAVVLSALAVTAITGSNMPVSKVPSHFTRYSSFVEAADDVWSDWVI